MSAEEFRPAHASLAKLRRRVSAFLLCNNAFFQAETEQELLQSICDMVVAGDDLRLAWIGYCENDPKKSVRPVAKSGPGVEHLDRVEFSWESAAGGQSPIELALRFGKPCWVNDVSTDPRFPDWRIAATEAGFASCVALPLIAHGRRQGEVDLRGTLQLCSAEPGLFDETTVEQYASLAICLTFAVAALRSTLVEALTSGVAVLRADQKRRHADESLRVMRAELARATRLLEAGQMAASIAHEINQPLLAVVANGNAALRWLARATPELDQARAALKQIVLEGGRAAEVIAGIRSMFKQDRPKAPHNVNEIVNEVLALVHGEAESSRISVRTQLAEQLPPVLLDRVQFRQVILNLIMNAIEAMSSQRGRARILNLRSEAVQPSGVMVTVEDTGPGIDKDSIDRVFKAFFTTKPNGMGLGLVICRSIVEAHGGRLLAAPGHPHGSAFQVILPVHRPDRVE